ncbi:MAG: hypothetical protein AABY11_00785, partial [archaeon]
MKKKSLQSNSRNANTSTSSSRGNGFSVIHVLSEALSRSLNLNVLGVQAMVLVLLLFAQIVWTGFIGLGVLLITIAFFSTSFIPLIFFGILFGLATWILGIMAINSFLVGVHYHISMQSVTRRVVDLNIAWKLAAARWKDAIIVNGSIAAMILIAFVLSALVVSWANPAALFPLGAHGSMSQLVNTLALSFLVVSGVMILLIPFFMLIHPTLYFENVSPAKVYSRVSTYMRAHVGKIFLTGVATCLIASLVSGIADGISLLAPMGVSPIFVLAHVAFYTCIQLLALVFTLTFVVHAQT